MQIVDRSLADLAYSPTKAKQVDLWIWELDDPVSPQLAAALSNEERKRVHCFAAPLHASRSLNARAVLRGILARYVGLPPAALQFSYGTHGKPALYGIQQPIPHFNLSHSGHIAALALCWDTELGIDIELMRPIEEDVAASFSVRERLALAELSKTDALRRFYHLWTCKEALLKGLGLGLAVPLDRLAIAILPDHPPQILDLNGDLETARQWQLRQFEPAAGFAGAYAVRSAQCSLRLMNLASMSDACA